MRACVRTSFVEEISFNALKMVIFGSGLKMMSSKVRNNVLVLQDPKLKLIMQLSSHVEKLFTRAFQTFN